MTLSSRWERRELTGLKAFMATTPQRIAGILAYNGREPAKKDLSRPFAFDSLESAENAENYGAKEFAVRSRSRPRSDSTFDRLTAMDNNQ